MADQVNQALYAVQTNRGVKSTGYPAEIQMLTLTWYLIGKNYVFLHTTWNTFQRKMPEMLQRRRSLRIHVEKNPA